MSRKSDVALPTIMNVFLMIAVILVASSFLLKAFGIDIWEFLNNLFAGLSSSGPGKVLHVKIDRAQNEVWEFHLTDEKKHCQEFYSSISCGQLQSSFYIDSSSWNKKECILFTTIQRDDQCVLAPPFGAIQVDAGNIYYVDPGSIIQNDKDCGKNLNSCLINPTSGCNFKDLKSSPEQYTIIGDKSGLTNLIPVFGTPCASDEDKNKILNYPYNSNAIFSDDSSGGCSIKKSLLEKDQYTVKEGLICDKDGIWQPCTKQRAKKSFGFEMNGIEFKCGSDGTWEEVNNPPSGVLKVSPLVTTVNDPISITIEGKDDKGVKSLSAYYGGQWYSYDCPGSPKECSSTWTILETVPGMYNYYGIIIDTAGQSSPTIPNMITVIVN